MFFPQMSQKHSLTIPGRYAAIQEACEFVAAGAEAVGFDEDFGFQVQLACDEACTNVIEHAYGAEGVGSISVTWELVRDQFTITIVDSGRPFDPAGVAEPDFPTEQTNHVDIKVGGLGMHIMRRVMDSVQYRFERGQNTLTMKKRVLH